MRSSVANAGLCLLGLTLLAACNVPREDPAESGKAAASAGAASTGAGAPAPPAGSATAAASEGAAAQGSVAAQGEADGAPARVEEADRQAAAEALGVPLYPGATVASAIVGSGDGGRGAMVTLETPALPAEVMSFYRERAAQAGFAVKAEVNAGTMRMLGAEKGERSLTIQVAPKEGGGSTVALLGGSR